MVQRCPGPKGSGERPSNEVARFKAKLTAQGSELTEARHEQCVTLIPQSYLGPPGLWLALMMSPPNVCRSPQQVVRTGFAGAHGRQDRAGRHEAGKSERTPITGSVCGMEGRG